MERLWYLTDTMALYRTLDDILLDLRGKNISELHSDQRAAASAKVDRGYRVMYDKEECERYEKGLKILSVAKRDLHLLAQDIFSQYLSTLRLASSADLLFRRALGNIPGSSCF